jgi:hypothetical protein
VEILIVALIVNFIVLAQALIKHYYSSKHFIKNIEHYIDYQKSLGKSLSWNNSQIEIGEFTFNYSKQYKIFIIDLQGENYFAKGSDIYLDNFYNKLLKSI